MRPGESRNAAKVVVPDPASLQESVQIPVQFPEADEVFTFAGLEVRQIRIGAFLQTDLRSSLALS